MKQSFQMLYAVAMTVRHFDGNKENTVQITVSVSNSSTSEGTRVYRSLNHPWVKAIIEGNDFTLEDLQNADDATEYDIDAVELESGRLFSVKTPALYQFFTVDGVERQRVVDNVRGVLLESSGLNVSDMVRSTMRFRLTALDDSGQHRYAIPNRKSTQLQLLQYWEGGPVRDFDEILDNLADEVDNEDKDEAEA